MAQETRRSQSTPPPMDGDMYTTSPDASVIVARTDADIIAGPQDDRFKGKLIIGTLDQATNPQWLQQAGVTHLCCYLRADDA